MAHFCNLATGELVVVDGLRLGVLLDAILRWTGVRTKPGVDMVPIEESCGNRSSKEKWIRSGGKLSSPNFPRRAVVGSRPWEGGIPSRYNQTSAFIYCRYFFICINYKIFLCNIRHRHWGDHNKTINSSIFKADIVKLKAFIARFIKGPSMAHRVFTVGDPHLQLQVEELFLRAIQFFKYRTWLSVTLQYVMR